MGMAVKNENILFGVGGLLAGLFTGATIVAAATKSRAGMSMAMEAMSKKLSALSGDSFDRELLKLMIVHHEATIDIAKLAEARAGHSELKALCDDIIKTQSQELADMHKWQQKWGFIGKSATKEMSKELKRQ